MQAGGRLVEDVHGFAVGSALQLGGKLDALRFTAGQGGCGLAESDVAEADVHEGLQVSGDAGVRLEEVGGLLDGHVEDVGHGLAVVRDFEGLAVVSFASTDFAGDVYVRKEMHLDL